MPDLNALPHGVAKGHVVKTRREILARRRTVEGSNYVTGFGGTDFVTGHGNMPDLQAARLRRRDHHLLDLLRRWRRFCRFAQHGRELGGTAGIEITPACHACDALQLVFCRHIDGEPDRVHHQ
jgi:hypothetical protein